MGNGSGLGVENNPDLGLENDSDLGLENGSDLGLENVSSLGVEKSTGQNPINASHLGSISQKVMNMSMAECLPQVLPHSLDHNSRQA